jgi:flagellar biosynthesis protein FlhF
MKVKRFHGATSREVLKAVREALGDNAIILSNRNVAEGVEVLAVAEEDMASIVAPPAMSSEGADAPAEVEARSLLRGARPAKGGRSERRVHHALPFVTTGDAGSPASADPVSSEIKSMRDLLEKQLAAFATRSQDAAPVGAELVAEMKSMRTAVQQQMANLARAAEAQKALADRNLAAENARLAAEIGTLRSLVERELAGLTWNETARRQPARAEAIRRCLQAGFSAALARSIADAAPTSLTEREVHKWLAAALEERLSVASPEIIIERGGMYALVGPTGVGKTTTTAKLAARCAMKFGARRLALVTMDTYRIGAHDHLRAYGKILGVPVHTAHDAATLADVLGSLGGKHLILIDTAGLAQRDDRVGPQIQSLVANDVQRLLVLNAAAQPETLEDVVEVYQGAGLAGCLLTKTDEAVKLGSALDVLLRHRLMLHYVANGQRVPEDLHAPNVRYLVHRALRAPAADAFALREDEIGLAATVCRQPEVQHAR